jgi:hypothetical protein
MNNNNSALIQEFTQHEYSGIVDNLQNYDFIGLNKDIIAENLENEVKVNTLVSTIITEKTGDKI